MNFDNKEGGASAPRSRHGDDGMTSRQHYVFLVLCGVTAGYLLSTAAFVVPFALAVVAGLLYLSARGKI